MTLIKSNRRKEIPLVIDGAGPGIIDLHSSGYRVRVTLYPDGYHAHLYVDPVSSQLMHVRDAVVASDGTILRCTGTVGSTTVIIEVEAAFDWSGHLASRPSPSVVDQVTTFGKEVWGIVTGSSGP